MSELPRNRAASPDATAPQQEPATPSAMSPVGRVPRTRTGAAWLAIWIAAVAFVVLIIFMLQNTRSVEVSFLWMHGSAPLALALLVAAVGAAILAMAVGAARITQLRRLFRRRR
jgi:uncharacterized integral membrane protein